MKNILLTVTGLSPQVVTETLCAIHQDGRDIHAIHLITTREGRDKLLTGLFDGEKGHYYRYLKEYGYDPETIDFSPANIHTIRDEYGNELPDIRTGADNECLLKTCLELTFRFTSAPDTALFFSIAGGRKTMSACLTLAAQLYGRPQDRLYHVLVSPEFENNRGFYYPPPESRTIEIHDETGATYHKESRYAKITLVNLPFISIRPHLAPENLTVPEDPGTLMLSLIRDPSSRLVADIASRKIIYKTFEADMSPAQFALYLFFLTQKKCCVKKTDTCGPCQECFLEFNEIETRVGQIRDFHQTIMVKGRSQAFTDFSYDLFKSLKSKINKSLQTRFGQIAQKDLEIISIGKKPDTRYGIPLEKKSNRHR